MLTLTSLQRVFTGMLLATLSFAIVGCSSENGDDLDAFMRDAAKNMHPNIKPIPEVKAYQALLYNADNTLVDPFHPRKNSGKSGDLQPNLNRPKEPMELYPLESIKYVGMLSKKNLTYALLQTPDNGVQQVKVGNFVGQNYGKITKISENEIILKEVVPDDLSGGWIERTSTLTLQ